MAFIVPITVEQNLGGELAGDITSVATTITVRHFDIKTGDAREPLSTSLLFTIDKGTSESENVLAGSHTTSAGITTYINCVRDISDSSVSVAAGTGSSHGEGAEVGHVTSHLPYGITAKWQDGTNASGANDLRVGNETAADVRLIFQNDQTVNPEIRFDEADKRWKINRGDDAGAAGDEEMSGALLVTTAEKTALVNPLNGLLVYDTDLGELQVRDGGSFITLASGGTFPNASTIVAGKVEAIDDTEIANGTSPGATGAPTVLTGDKLVKTSSGAGDENRVPVLNASGQLAGGFIDSSAFIDQTIIDAKGDLIGGTANDTVARLPVGGANQILTADSGETTGMKWESKSIVRGFGIVSKDVGDSVVTQNIPHGMGVTPAFVTFSVLKDNSTSMGGSNGSTNTCVFSDGILSGSVTDAIRVDDGGGNARSADATLNSTNIVLTWSKNGTPAGTASIFFEAMTSNI